MGRFDGQVVLVTGATGGMGASHVRAFHEEGAAVVVAARDETRGRELVAELGDRALFTPLEVTDEKQWAVAVEAAEERFGAVSVLVNNAGVQHAPTLLEDADPALWERTLAVNVTGAALGIRAVAPGMRRLGRGVVVNVGSVMAHGGTPFFGPYVVSKWALRGLTRTAALELARDGVRVNAIHPGVVETPLITAPGRDGAAPIIDSYSPAPFAVPRLAQAGEVSRLLLFLASPDAAFATGAEFVLDGGLSLGPALAAA